MAELTIVCGCFGSGKTELSMSMAKKAARSGESTALVDLDVINPMFNCEHHRAELLRHGIHLISTPIEKRCDCPSLSPEIYAALDGAFEHAVFDVGGDKAGSIVLGAFHDRIQNTGADVRMLFVVNTRRPMSSSPEQILEAMNRVSTAARLPISGLVNNTNLGTETSADLLDEGQTILNEVSDTAGIPILYYAGTAEALRAAGERYSLTGEPFEINPINRPDFMRFQLKHGNVFVSKGN